MKKYIEEYIENIDKALENSKTDLNDLRDDLLVNIEFFQHERLVHLLVMMLVSILTVILLVTNLFIDNIFLLIMLLIFVLLLIPYIFHYYFLENKVQLLYSYYNKIKIKK